MALNAAIIPMRLVRPARWAISTGGVVLAAEAMLWWPATQKRH